MYVPKLVLLICFALSTILVSVYLFSSPHQYVEYILSADTALESVEMGVRRISGCLDKKSNPRVDQRGDYFVLYDFVTPTRNFACHESVTYTTLGDFTFMDNVPALVRRWMGPVSLALYAPGEDFHKTIASIAYLRNCETPFVREFVTFHVFFIVGHFPKVYEIPLIDSYEDIYDCQLGSPYLNASLDNLYRRKNNLTFPINLARNIAKQAATTHFVFASDIELFPTPDFIPKFLRMITDNPEYSNRKNPRVYALAMFEVPTGEHVPQNKTALQKMIKNGQAFFFHEKLCASCHKIPKYEDWVDAKETQDLAVFTVSKRLHDYKNWEAFYIGTQDDPLFDERLSWENQKDKMPQAFSLCLLNYDYMVLDNAFLVHKPGIKKSKDQETKFKHISINTNSSLQKNIEPELIALYGSREGCYL